MQHQSSSNIAFRARSPLQRPSTAPKRTVSPSQPLVKSTARRPASPVQATQTQQQARVSTSRSSSVTSVGREDFHGRTGSPQVRHRLAGAPSVVRPRTVTTNTANLNRTVAPAGSRSSSTHSRDGTARATRQDAQLDDGVASSVGSVGRGSTTSSARNARAVTRATTANTNTAGSRESRLLRVTKDYQQLTLRLLLPKIQEAESKSKRLLCISTADMTSLSAYRDRNDAFMRNVEAIMQEAVAEGRGIEGAIVQHAYRYWGDANEMNQRIDAVIRKPRSISPLAQRSSTPPRCGSVGGVVSRRSSPGALPRSPRPQPRPTALQDVAPIVRKPGTQHIIRAPGEPLLGAAKGSTTLSPARSSALTWNALRGSSNGSSSSSQDLPAAERRCMLEGLEVLAKRSHLTDADTTWAQSVFVRLYGRFAGQKKYAEWMDERTMNALRHARTLPRTSSPSRFVASNAVVKK